AGLSTTPTGGAGAGNYFTINGVQITVDPANDTLNDVLNRITTLTNAAPGNVGVNATLVNDANGNPNFIQLTPAGGNAQAIQLGSGSDTTNFLSAAHLVATGIAGGGAGGAVSSTAPLSSTSTGAARSSDRLNARTL